MNESKQEIAKEEGRDGWDYFADDMAEDDENDWCYECGNEGVIITCCDDLCVGAGKCMHGDGEIICPECGGDW